VRPSDSVQRVGFLAAVPPILRSLGINSDDVLRQVDLAPDALTDPEATIAFAAMGRLVDVAARQASCPHIGLLIGSQITTTSLGLIGELMRNAPTLGTAMRDLATHQHRHARGAVAYLLNLPGQALFGYAIYQPGIAGAAQISDGAAAGTFNLIAELIGRKAMAGAEVVFARTTPVDLEPYRRRFSGAKLRFDSEQSGTMMPRAWLERPVIGADPARRQLLETQVESFWRAGDFDIVTQLRRALRVGLLTGQISRLQIAARLGLTPRTFARRLADHDAGFQDLLDEARCEFAMQLLGETRISASEISLILRYADPSIFSRAFLRWSTLTPRDWRAAHLANEELSKAGA